MSDLGIMLKVLSYWNLNFLNLVSFNLTLHLKYYHIGI